MLKLIPDFKNMKKKCLIVYIGCGYSGSSHHHTGTYSIDMRENRKNHHENVFYYLEKNNYDLDFCLFTNKHEKYDDFIDEYKSIKIDYSDFTVEDFECLLYYCEMRALSGWGPGNFNSGGRLLKLKGELPKYDLYVFVRSDLFFKKRIEELNVDFDKLNYLWAETDPTFFSDREYYVNNYGSEMFFWNHHNRVSGATFLITPYKFVNIVTRYLWADHLSLFLMLKDLNPLFTIKDVNVMCGLQNAYVSDANSFENPIYLFNKKRLNKTNIIG